MTPNQNSQDRMLAAGELYAKADRSDPFTMKRILLHLSNGISEAVNSEGKSSYYSAEPYPEVRKYIMNGEERAYTVTMYRNMVRP